MEYSIKDVYMKQARKMANSLKRQANPKMSDVAALLVVLTNMPMYFMPQRILNLETAAVEAFETEAESVAADVLALAEAKIEYVKTVELPATKKIDVVNTAIESANVQEDGVEVLEG